MNFLWLIPSACALLFAGIAVSLFLSRERLRLKLHALHVQIEGMQEQLAERKTLREQLDAAITARHEAEKRVELGQQQMAGLELRMKDWETQREESMRTAKAAILEAGGHMSSKLLEDHKREQEAQKKEQEERLKNATASLIEQMTHITQVVGTLKTQTHDTQSRMDTVWQALSNPAGAGQLAEVGLENTLKGMALEPGRDFIMQYALSDQDGNGRLRPDCILFLPQDVVVVIDSKASKYLLELAQAGEGDARAQVMEKLKRTMNQHLRDLASKDYANAVLNMFRMEGHGKTIRVLLNVMYLPSEAALEHIREADREFPEKLERAGIILAGPASLHGLFSLAKLQIAAARQAENYDEIISVIEDVMESVITVLGYADNIGSYIRKASDAFNKMGSSANRRLLPRLKKLSALGLKPAKNKALPSPIATYDMQRVDDALTFDLEAEEATIPNALTSPAPGNNQV